MRVTALVLFSMAFAGNGFCDSFQTTFLAAGVQTPAGITSNYESFDSVTPGANNLPFTTTYNNSGFTGTYSGAIDWYAANVYGGASGKATYPETFSSYTVSINPSVNYFGLWFSALDAGNQLSFYRDNTLLYTFTPADFIRLVGNCPGSAFCGNPNASQSGDTGQQYAYLNFYDSNGTFDKIVFNETGGGGFESDNHAVGLLASAPGGTQVTTPEPATTAALGLALLAGGLVYRRKRAINA